MTGETGEARSPGRGGRTFWLAHFGGWVVYFLALYSAWAPTLEPAARRPLLVNLGFRVAIAAVGSALIYGVYRQVQRRAMSRVGVLCVVLAVCALTGAASYMVHRLVMREVFGFGDLSLPFFVWRVFPMGTQIFTSLYVAWTCVYFGLTAWASSQVRATEAAEARRLAQEAQLQMLAYQLNPHFLFNALNSLRALVDENPARARDMVTELAGFLRYALEERPLRMARIAEEIEAVEAYLAIELIRFEERLDVQIDVGREAMGCFVPAFLLHPLVENAVKHGAPGGPEEPLRLRVSARVEGQRLSLCVANTGSIAPANAENRGNGGIGLRNVRSRLQQLFPGRHRVSIEERSAWVRTLVELPALFTDAAAPLAHAGKATTTSVPPGGS